MAAVPRRSFIRNALPRKASARHKPKISLAPINSLPGKICLVAAIGGACDTGDDEIEKVGTETDAWQGNDAQIFAEKNVEDTERGR
jgi:hypothetical protein